jgi:starvation-inducible DNA-binding protein
MERTMRIANTATGSGKVKHDVAQLHNQVVEQMKKTLADEYFIQLKTQNFHWNVEGPLFFSLHKLFEEQYKQIADFVDESAEVIRALRGHAPGSFQEFKLLTSIHEAPAEKMHFHQMIESLSEDHSSLVEDYVERLEGAEMAGEVSAVKLYEDLISFHEKAAWMIRSHRA